MDKLAHVYAELRRESSHGQGVPIAVRHIESMIRMSKTHARMPLKQHVIQEDVDTAIRVLLDSLISSLEFKKLCKRYWKECPNSLLCNFCLLTHHYLSLVGIKFDSCASQSVSQSFRKYMTNCCSIYSKSSKRTLAEQILRGSSSRLSHIDVKVENCIVW